MHFQMHCDNTVLHYDIAIYKHIHGDLLIRMLCSSIFYTQQ